MWYLLEFFYSTRKPTENKVYLMLSWFSGCIKTKSSPPSGGAQKNKIILPVSY